MVLVHTAMRADDSILLQRRSVDVREPAARPATSTVEFAPEPAPESASESAPEFVRLAKFHAPEIVFGPGSLPEAAHAAVRLGARRPLVVTDPGLLAAGWPDELLGYLREAGLQPCVWHHVTPNPKDHEIEAGFAHYLA